MVELDQLEVLQCPSPVESPSRTDTVASITPKLSPETVTLAVAARPTFDGFVMLMTAVSKLNNSLGIVPTRLPTVAVTAKLRKAIGEILCRKGRSVAKGKPEDTHSSEVAEDHALVVQHTLPSLTVGVGAKLRPNAKELPVTVKLRLVVIGALCTSNGTS